jgi:hypothetical protein
MQSWQYVPRRPGMHPEPVIGSSAKTLVERSALFTECNARRSTLMSELSLAILGRLPPRHPDVEVSHASVDDC